MEVSPRFKHTLSVDTNISYSLDMSKFPGLDDPRYKSQPALLIAASTNQGQTEMIPSPTLELPGSHVDLLGDILSVIEKYDTDTGPDGNTDSLGVEDYRNWPRSNNQLAQTNHQQLNHLHHHPSTSLVLQLPCNKEGPGAPPGNTNISKYAMDMIFHKLIYPDVSHGYTFSLDTLIQSAPRGQVLRSAATIQSRDYINRLNTITDNMTGLPSTSSLRQGKRKRGSSDASCDLENSKRVRCETKSYIPHGAWKNRVSSTGYHPRRVVLS